MKQYLVSGPSRLSASAGFDVGRGGRNRARALGGYYPGVGGGDPLSGIKDAWDHFLASGVDVGQIALGSVLLGAGLLILLSQTSAGAGAGRLAGGVTRRGLRAVPVVGALA